MPRKAVLLKSLTRGRLRASMNKYNLFNLYKKQRPGFNGQSLYQQKWNSKAETRAYHGEHLRESKWQHIFSPKLQGVAQLDASLQGGNTDETPMMLQTFAVLEKRLDVALFRAMFASSVRQARQYIIHKYVSVNGVVMRHPNYELKPGDVFSVRPDKVLEALGKAKPDLKTSYKVDQIQISRWNKFVKESKASPLEVWQRQQAKKQSRGESNLISTDDKERVKKIREFNNKLQARRQLKQQSTTRQSILVDVIDIVRGTKKDITPEVFESKFGSGLKEKVFQIYQTLGEKHNLLNLPEDENTLEHVTKFITDKEPIDEFKQKRTKQLLSEINTKYLEHIREQFEQSKVSEDAKELPYDPSWADSLRRHKNLSLWEEVKEHGEKCLKVNFPWQKGLFGRQDSTKAYFTPWTPRPFLAPFAVLPQHLEISFETCHAVYLRDPVSRPGESEVITPLPVDVHKRAYMWYQRKGQ
ncbi:37S ribosomal protein, mitochondrial [Komagataella phaffii CBS 7435]|uniref:Small ribosomal subunit protein uS4m n=2 Tax=Komagataella phaffii TaxID=460519 RepID=C4R204_KOMPG|nr:Mitochondrial ribosomal component of the small subunit [Komagataella phaffii GS115]AOA62984.1 GQ67_00949T0 [Komagataella phaffii]CAH2447927.1 37S ribosomal protein, mitochondrial [Komagataella phaffii CBS 7435]AOA67500.1 GQ68_00440T0 [Komagataella phaffii GS115]CAY69528.1 Mitochondrial ribosomal component of the small subunit [Komagataella phaffii GS115]CCA38091.1 37S ribosomal protein, mitochondrial [Komagataella phaffii CBS 7435]